MKKTLYILFSISVLGSILFCEDTRSISPTISIRYDNFLQDMTPSSTIGIILKIDEDRYTGFDTADGEVRLLVGWRWTILGIGTKTIDPGDGSELMVGQYSFGAKYEVMQNMFTSTEYVRVDHDSQDDYIRLSVSIEF